MNILIFMIAFLAAVDENALTRVLHRPLAACTLFGAALGNTALGASVGAVLEVQAIALDCVREGSYTLVSLAAVLLAVLNGLDPAEAAAGASFMFLAGALLENAASAVSAIALPGARKAAEKRNETGLLIGTLIPALIYGLITGAIAMVMVSFGTDFAAKINAMLESSGWILSGLSAAGLLLPAVGIAILLRNLNVRQMPGAFMGGFAAAAVMLAAGLKGSALILCGFIAFAAASLAYHTGALKPEAAAEKPQPKKGGQKWW